MNFLMRIIPNAMSRLWTGNIWWSRDFWSLQRGKNVCFSQSWSRGITASCSESSLVRYSMSWTSSTDSSRDY